MRTAQPARPTSKSCWRPIFLPEDARPSVHETTRIDFVDLPGQTLPLLLAKLAPESQQVLLADGGEPGQQLRGASGACRIRVAHAMRFSESKQMAVHKRVGQPAENGKKHEDRCIRENG